MIARAAVVLLAALAAASPRPAGAATALLCDDAAERAARENGVPPALMRAIALVETRRTRDGRSAAWPWTLNVAGEGAWFEDRSEALAHARAALARGVTSIDFGCFQINRRWHGGAFESLDAMLDPMAGASYAARFLRELHAETGDWMVAAGLYHSRTPELAVRYRARVEDALAWFDPRSPRLAARAREPVRKDVRSIRTAASLQPMIDRNARGGLLLRAPSPLLGRARGPLVGPRS